VDAEKISELIERLRTFWRPTYAMQRPKAQALTLQSADALAALLAEVERLRKELDVAKANVHWKDLELERLRKELAVAQAARKSRETRPNGT